MTFLKLIRFKNLLMVLLIMILTKYALIDHYYETQFLNAFLFFIACLSILSLTAAGYVVNDILDVQADQINKPEKLYISTSISQRNAWILYVVLTIIGLVACFYVIHTKSMSFDYLIIYSATILLLFLYSKYFKRLPLIGNLVIAFFCAFVIYITFELNDIPQESSGGFFGFLANFGNSTGLFIAVLGYVVFSFLTTLIREMVKDIEDIDGDHNMRMKTLPIVLGVKRSRNVIIIISLFFAVLLILFIKAIFEDSKGIFLGLYFTILILLPFLLFLYRLWSASTKKHFHSLSNLMKLIMLFGILSMGIFKFI